MNRRASSRATSTSWVALSALALVILLLGCNTDCDDAAGKLAACELPAVAGLEAACDDEGALACQARCMRDTSCRQVADSMAGNETDFDRCAAACGGPALLSNPEDGDGGASGGGGSDAEQ